MKYLKTYNESKVKRSKRKIGRWAKWCIGLGYSGAKNGKCLLGTKNTKRKKIHGYSLPLEYDKDYYYELKESKEIDDDSDTMSRYQLFEADTTMAFNFAKVFVIDSKKIKELIDKYNETYNKENEWGGGPVNREFSRYFIDTYNRRHTGGSFNWVILGNKAPVLNHWKPSISLIIKTPDYGNMILGYSIITKKCVSINWSEIKSYKDMSDYDREVVNGIYSYCRSNIYDKKITIDETVNLLFLKIENRVNWEWEEKVDIKGRK